MFERFSEEARRAIYFARFEASQSKAKKIDGEALLLGILRPDAPLTRSLLRSIDQLPLLRRRIQGRASLSPQGSPVVELPLSKEVERAIEYAGEESAGQRELEVAHLLLGLLRAGEGAAKLLQEFEVSEERIRRAGKLAVLLAHVKAQRPEPGIGGIWRDLSAAAADGRLDPLIGREGELERVMHILSRRSRNSVALIGESGVGRTAIVEGLAGRMVEGMLPFLAGARIASIHATVLLDAARNRGKGDPPMPVADTIANAIYCVEGLFDLAAGSSGWGLAEALCVLGPQLARKQRFIVTGTPAGFRQIRVKAPELANYFQVVEVLAPSEEETFEILRGIKGRYETYHDVTIGEEAIGAAIALSRRFLMQRQLPDRAIDLMDEACVRARTGREAEPRELRELRKKIRGITVQMAIAIEAHEFERAQQLSVEESKESANLAQWLRDHPQVAPTVTAEDVEAVVAERSGASAAVVRRAAEPVEENRRNVLAFYELLLEEGKTAEALAQYAAATYVEHSPLLGGRAGRRVEIQRTIAEKDCVVLHSRQQDPGGKEWAGMDMFRLDDRGKIVEHWAVEQAAPGNRRARTRSSER